MIDYRIRDIMKILNQKSRRKFDVENPKDLEIFANFLKNSAWGPNGCPFQPEEDWISIPDMIKDKIVRKAFGI